MNLEMEKIKREYLCKILGASLNNRNYSTIVFRASFCLDEIKNIIEELKDEYYIDNVIFMDFDNSKVKSFYEFDPTEEEIERFIPKFPKPIGNVKIIYFINDTTDYSENYNNYFKKYYMHLKKYNGEVFDTIENLSVSDITVTACPNKEWAEVLLGSQERLEELWIEINKTLLSPDLAKKEVEERIERKKELNRMNIRNLFFYTDLGTDFRISLNSHSIWNCEPKDVEGIFNFYNYPSYEIYTSPNCYSAEGKIVLSKKRRFYYDILVENAIFEFSKGKLISSKSNSEIFDSIILNNANKMNRIGEIALVSQSSPLAKIGEFYDSVLFDENTGCHFALGDSIDECIAVEKEKLEEKGARYYRYNTSKFHTDFVFGDDSISVEAETKGKKKVLLMEKGVWKI
ncbi:MAG: aminopeptidase [Bacilli bacterium]